MRYRSKSGAHSLKRAVSLHGALTSFSDWNLYATPTDAVRQLTGHPPRTVEEYIERNLAAFC
jgi:hypothetical protein